MHEDGYFIERRRLWQMPTEYLTAEGWALTVRKALVIYNKKEAKTIAKHFKGRVANRYLMPVKLN